MLKTEQREYLIRRHLDQKKKFSCLHEYISKFMNHCVQSGNVPEWMVVGRMILLMKDPKKGPEVGNYRLIACRNLLLKLLTGVFSEKVYTQLDQNGILSA